MRPRTSRLRLWVHLGLLLAAALQFAGTAVGPWAHLAGGGAAGAAVVSPQPGEGGPDAPPHDERSCFACLAFGAVGVPGSGASLPEVPAAAQAPAPAAAVHLSILDLSLPQARSPPA